MMTVSFVIPTLNRKGYVNRAVRSCLAQSCAAVDVQVVVLDSQSADGSWESLQEEFGANSRVVLLQNKRGSGPLRSWLDGAEQVTGDAVTFVWSDDYVFPNFCTVLLPAILEEGARFAFGGGLVRDLAEDEPPKASLDPASSTATAVMVEAFLGVTAGWTPVSPACALFARGSFDEWLSKVEELSTSTELRRQLQWHRAIGPDLMLFLIALSKPAPMVGVAAHPVAQFSHHDGSITVSSDQWPLLAGYWLTLCTAVTDLGLAECISVPRRGRAYAKLALSGLKLHRRAPQRLGVDLARRDLRRSVLAEVRGVLRRGQSDIGTWGLVVGARQYFFEAIARRVIQR